MRPIHYTFLTQTNVRRRIHRTLISIQNRKLCYQEKLIVPWKCDVFMKMLLFQNFYIIFYTIRIFLSIIIKKKQFIRPTYGLDKFHKMYFLLDGHTDSATFFETYDQWESSFRIQDGKPFSLSEYQIGTIYKHTRENKHIKRKL